jgi:hypothetical protein
MQVAWGPLAKSSSRLSAAILGAGVAGACVWEWPETSGRSAADVALAPKFGPRNNMATMVAIWSKRVISGPLRCDLIHQHHIQRTGTVTKIIQEQLNCGGLAKDDNEAARPLKLAADQGDTKAQAELAELNKRLPK